MSALGINTNWPVDVPTSIQNTPPAYLYFQYQNDDNISAFFTAFNLYAQAYVNWFNALNMPIYTQAPVAGSLLDWIGQSIYGMLRPGLQIGQVVREQGLVNAFVLNTLPVNELVRGTSQSFQLASDDYYRRALTWAFYKGDGKVVSPRWLKRRINRFLNGINGTDIVNDQQFDISVQFSGYMDWTITLTDSPAAEVFQAFVRNGVLELPVQGTWTVDLI